MDLVDLIKLMSHGVTENYLKLGVKPNDSISSLLQEGAVPNDEVLKRVIELTNQNIYLSLFNDKSVDKTNITFDLADYDKIKESESNMNDYAVEPKDFRVFTPMADIDVKPSGIVPEKIKLGALNECVQYRDRMNTFVSKMATLREASALEAIDLFNKMAHDAKLMVANGESIGDISKLACLVIKDENIDFTKTAKAYEIIRQELVKKGFFVKTDFTKVSSMTPNPDSEALQPAKAFAVAIEKRAAFDDMYNNAKKVLDQFNYLIKNHG